MKRLLLPLTLVGFSVISSLYLTSCKDDEDPAPIPKITFESANRSVNEDAGTIEIIVELDNPAPEDIVVEYSISGTATRKTSSNTPNPDYEFLTFAGEVEIDKGDDFGTISIKIIDDTEFEDNETIILSLEDVDSDKVDFGNRDQITITIQDNDEDTSGEDDVTASFTATTLIVKESVKDVLEIIVQLDKQAPTDLTINYDLGEWLQGSNIVPNVAIDAYRASQLDEFPMEYVDYQIEGTSGALTINEGQESGVILIEIRSDFHFENNETITLTLKPSAGVKIGDHAEMIITVEQEDGRAIFLNWEHAEVDMDLFVWAKDGASYAFLWNSAFADTEGPELVFIPNLIVESLAAEGYDPLEFGMSYVYYEGPDDPIEFTVIIADFVDGDFEGDEDVEIKNATYTNVNKNPWDTVEEPDFEIVQTFVYTGGVYGPASDITVPASGSRRGFVSGPNVERKSVRFKQETRKPL